MSQQSSSFPTPRIIVTYRRDDAEEQAQRLIQTLRRRFGDDSVKTCYDLPESELVSPRWGAGESPVVVVVIGRRWFKEAKGPGPSSDDIRAPMTATLAFLAGLYIITVLVKGAPSSSAELSHPLRLRDALWGKDIEKLVGRLEGLGVSQSRSAAGERASDDLVKVNLRREDAVKLVTALTLYLGSVPEAPRGVKKGGGENRGKYRINRGLRVSEDLFWSARRSSKVLFWDSPPESGIEVVGRHEILEGEVAAKPAEVEAADIVSCTVFSPSSVKPGANFLVQVFAHLPADLTEASQLARWAVRESENLGSKTLDLTVRWWTKLRVDLSLPGLAVDDPSQHLIWRGRPEPVQFGVTVLPTHPPGNVIGTVRVSQDGVPFGHVKFQLTVAAPDAAAPAPYRQATWDWVRYKKAFISYAREDLDEVLKRLQMLDRLNPDFFLDLLRLTPGQRWAKGLYKYIDESDVFFLFWSTAAKRSRWVMREVDYALARKGDDESAPPEIIPMVIEGPPPVKPPRRLSHLQFDDMFLYFMTRPEKKAGAKQKGRPRKRRQP